jgi:peptide-methionine (S)-S-oxide reductase
LANSVTFGHARVAEIYKLEFSGMRSLRQKLFWLLGILFLAASVISGIALLTNDPPPAVRRAPVPPVPEGMEVATFGAGCFWCTEAVFQQLRGVQSVVSGYSGGHVPDPTYRQVCGGETGHAEVIRVVFDPRAISYAELLEAFWKSHDPTTENRQGNDVGPQYRSVIFCHNQAQRDEAEHYRQRLDESAAFPGPIVTEIEQAREFYPAEMDHQNYFAENGRMPYCIRVIQPKVEKFRQAFADKLKSPGED